MKRVEDSSPTTCEASKACAHQLNADSGKPLPDSETTQSLPINWWVYILRCADNTLYTGITTDLQRRVNEHNGLDAQPSQKGARYTRSRRPVKLVHAEEAETRATASKREYALKRLSRTRKEALLASQCRPTIEPAR